MYRTPEGRDRPVKRMRRTEDDRIVLIFYGPAGEPGPQLVVTQAEWKDRGREEFMMDEDATPEKLRAMEAANVPPPAVS